MQMNVKPIPTLDPRVNEIRALTAKIVNQDILPNEKKLWAGWRDGGTDEDRRSSRELRESIKAKVKKAGCGHRICRRNTVAPGCASSSMRT